jgi:hypothetical protein
MQRSSTYFFFSLFIAHFKLLENFFSMGCGASNNVLTDAEVVSNPLPSLREQQQEKEKLNHPLIAEISSGNTYLYILIYTFNFR